MLRRLLLLALLAVPLAASAREPTYITAQELDLVSILPPPVVAGSAADREQLAVVLRAQRTASPERIEQARRDADESVDTMFAAVLGKALPASALPATTRLFARLEDTEDAVVAPTKTAFKRVRPYLSDPEIKALVRPSITGSYPSGHTTHITASSIVMGDIVPEKRDAIWERAHDYAWSRVIAGMHYPNDLDGGRLTGTAIAVALRNRPEFKADFDAAKRELRQYLGLAP
ncbi:acid phosphatase [Reyranella soli]|uniref:acid phosphatase n=2 Tax=Reyranella soli TaxID=1230389 RepID=A0A512NFW7_9HYPH|nr:acid phosphatase [Reyranella soli]